MKLVRNKYIDRKETRLFAIVLVLYAFFSFWIACSVDSTLYIPAASTIKKVVASLTLVVLAIHIFGGKITFERKYWIFCLFPVAHFLLSYFNHYDDDHFVSAMGVFLLITFILTDSSSKTQIYIYFKKLIYIISILGIICYASYIIGIPLPHTRTVYYGDDSWFYINYYLSVLVEADGSIRLCGLFNEPGYFGTFLGLICVLDLKGDKIDIKNNIVFLIAGLLTFSLAFFLTIVLGYLLKQASKPSRWVIIIVFSLLYLFVLPNIHTGNANVDHVIERLTIGDSGISGDNRSSLTLDMMLVETVAGNNAVWGHGMGYVSSFDMNVSSYKIIIVDSGLGGFVLQYVLFMVAVFVKYRKVKVAYPFIFVFFLNVYQRPNIYNVVYFIVLFGGLSYLEYKNKNVSLLTK